MAKLSLLAGTTSKLLRIFVPNSSVTTGAGLTGLVYNSASLIGYWIREGDSSATAITLATMTVGTWATGGFKEIDSTHMAGCYEVGIPDAALAAGAKSVLIMFSGATNMAPVVLEIELTAVDNQSATAFMTSAGVSGDFSATMKTSLQTASAAAITAAEPIPATVAGSVGGISGVTLPAVVPSLAQMQAGLPTDATIQADITTVIGAAGVSLTAVSLSAAGNNAITAALAALAVSVAPTAGTWGEAIAFALSGIGKAKVTYAPPSGVNTNDGVLTVYAKDGTTVLKSFTGVNVDAAGNTTVRV